MRTLRWIALAPLVAGTLLVAACGQRGALYLPDAQPQAVPAPPASDEAAGADRKAKTAAGAKPTDGQP